MRRAIRRKAVSGAAQNRLQVKTFPAPSNGLVLDQNIAMATPGGAAGFENWFPTTTGCRVRGGSVKYQEISTGPVASIWNYKSGGTEKFFAADSTNVFDITAVVDADVIPSSPAIMGQTAGYYSTRQFGTAGGDYLVIVNGSDDMWQFDGSTWYPVNSAAVNTLAYDGGSVAFVRGETVTGAGGASATIIAVNGDATSGTLYIGPVTSGPFIDDEVLTGSSAGAAMANGAESSLSTLTISGVDTADLSQCWIFANRLFFVEKNTMNAWYLPVDSIGGTANSFSFAGIFQNGGSLYLGATWSLDSGDGLDDKCVFVSTEGEVAVYEGTDPSNANAWSKVGVYEIGKPLGIKATMRAGGDLLIATDIGLVALSQAISNDKASLALTQTSRAIHPKWLESVDRRRELPWELLKWSSKSMMIVSQPRTDSAVPAQCLPVNLETGKWGYYIGWDVRCTTIFDDRGFFGANDGIVYEMEAGGSDNGTPYTCSAVCNFDHLGNPGSTKTAYQVRAVFKSASPFEYKISASVDYQVSLPTPPSSTADYTASVWDVGLWDDAIWDGSDVYQVYSRWTSVGKTGFTHAPEIQITCGTTPTPQIELVSFDLTYAGGAVVV